MELNDTDMDGLKETPTLAAMSREIPFTVPLGYFDALSDHLKARVITESVRFVKEEEFKVPGNYFKQLPARIETRIALENIRASVSGDGLIVPAGYFSNLAERISSRLYQDKSESKPVRKLYSSWISYAAAACISIAIGSSIYFNSTFNSFGKQLSKIPDQEIINYLQIHSTTGDTPFIIENLNPDDLYQITTDVSSEELEQYINNTTL